MRIKSRINYQIHSLLTARELLVRTRVRTENELRGLLRAFGVLFGKRLGGLRIAWLSQITRPANTDLVMC